MATVELRDVGKSYGGREVLARMNLAVGDGELVCLLGPSGCGKTTLLRIVAGFVRPDSGAVLVAGRDVTGLSARGRRMGMVFQSYSLFPNMTARDNVGFGPRVAGRPRRDQRDRAAALLELVGLSAQADQYPHQLSGGQQQRVALARALAIQPDVLLLDEPLSALDAKVRAQLRVEIRRIQREAGVTTLLVTHDQEEALSISDRVAVMHAGRLLQLDTPSRLYREPAHGFVARFIGAGAVLSGTAQGPAVQVAGHLLPALAAAPFGHDPVELFLRPEHVRLGSPAEAPGGAVPVEIGEMIFLGALTRIRLILAGSADGLVGDLPSEQAETLAPGARMAAWWDPAAPRVMRRD